MALKMFQKAADMGLNGDAYLKDVKHALERAFEEAYADYVEQMFRDGELLISAEHDGAFCVDFHGFDDSAILASWDLPELLSGVCVEVLDGHAAEFVALLRETADRIEREAAEYEE